MEDTINYIDLYDEWDDLYSYYEDDDLYGSFPCGCCKCCGHSDSCTYYL
jgi:hypothetical protein